MLDETLGSTANDERIRPSSKSNVEEQLLPTGFYQQVIGSQFSRWNPFDGMTPVSQMNGGPIGEQDLGHQSSTEPNHSCSQERSKRTCSPGSEGVWQEKGGKEKRNGWKCEEEQRNGFGLLPPHFTNLPNNGHPQASDHRPSNGGNILMVSSGHPVNPDNTFCN